MGKKIRVRVSFTDDLETTETLTSDAYPSGGTVTAAATAQVLGVTVAPGNAHLVVTWTAVDNATGYTVQWRSGSQGYNTGDRQATVTSGSTTRYTIPSLTNGTEYAVRVIATRTGTNDGSPSAEVKGTPFTTPGAPQHLSGVPGDAAGDADLGRPVERTAVPRSSGTSMRSTTARSGLTRALIWRKRSTGLTNGRGIRVRGVGAETAPVPVRRRGRWPGRSPRRVCPSRSRPLRATERSSWSGPSPRTTAARPSPATSTAMRRGSFVPEDTPWQSAWRSLEWTISGLTNGRGVRVRGAGAEQRRSRCSGEDGGHAARRAECARVAHGPLRATERVVLEWTEPADDGGSPVTGYEYRHAAGSFVPEGHPMAIRRAEPRVDGHRPDERPGIRVRGAGGERGRRRPGDVGDSDALHHARRAGCT